MAEEGLSDAEVCPHCSARLEPEAESCLSCGKPVFEDEPGEEGTPEYSDLVLVFRGQPTEVLSLDAALQGRGFKTFVPDATMKVVDPFITGGGNALLFELMAPVGEAEAVREAIEELRSASKAVELEKAAPEPVPAGNDEPFERLEQLARNTRFSWLLLPPLVVYWGGQYLILSSQLGRRSSRHGMTIVAFWIGLVESILVGGVVVWLLRR